MRKKDGNLRPLLRKHLPAVHWTTVESGALAPGTPDVNGCIDGSEFWIETKWTGGWVVSLRPEQVGWLTRRARAGGRAFVLVRRTSERTGDDQLWLLDGAGAEVWKVGGLRAPRPALGCWAGGPSSWDWTALLALLTRSGQPAGRRPRRGA